MENIPIMDFETTAREMSLSEEKPEQVFDQTLSDPTKGDVKFFLKSINPILLPVLC